MTSMSPSHYFLSGFCLMSPGADEEILWPGSGAGLGTVHKGNTQFWQLSPAHPFLAIFTSFWHCFAVQGEIAGGDLSRWEIPGRGHWMPARLPWSQKHYRRASPGSKVVWEQVGVGWDALCVQCPRDIIWVVAAESLV